MKYIFRADASMQIGNGHVERCLTLAEYLKKSGFDVSFICRELPGNLIEKIIGRGFQVFKLEEPVGTFTDGKLYYSHLLGVSQEEDARQSAKILEEIKPDWLIVDHYALDYQWEGDLRHLCSKIFVIDDLCDRKHDCDYLLDQSLGRKLEHYTGLVESSCKVLVGAQYSLLRPEFALWRDYSLKRRQTPQFKKLLISMGGTDIENYTADILDQLLYCNLPNDLTISIILGLNCPNLDSVTEKIKQLGCKVVIKENIDNMAEIMANSDIAIGAAGTTSLERCCLGVPTIQFITAHNQNFLAENLVKHKAALSLENSESLSSLINVSLEWVNSVSSSAARVTDGTGASKIAEVLMTRVLKIKDLGCVDMIDYVHLSAESQVYTHKMRNHIEIKKWMYSQKDISLDQHNEFLKNLVNDTKRVYFLIKFKSKIIGSINFSKLVLNDSVNLGIYTNPYEKVENMGKILEATANAYTNLKWGALKIKLEVFSSNLRAVRFYKKCGYNALGTKKFKGEEILLMEKLRDSLDYA
jgi:UDP-2,4-diacetamido-2,4,6-trideoxy-beta-L-altropyranose hydrolase/UDP-4-amino-4,6-dideoxy-N-acetyl-beta-L-altrosamine N-acetyltransferase